MQRNKNEGLALILYDKASETLYGLKRAKVGRFGEPPEFKVECTPMLKADPELWPVLASAPDAQRILGAERTELSVNKQPQVLEASRAWHLLQLWASLYGTAALPAEMNSN